MRYTTVPILLSLLLSSPSLAAPNEPCYGPSGIAGVCITDAACSSAGGTSISGACPADAANIKCCSKPKCSSGNCRWTSDCAGTSAAGQCPGPSQMKCCSSAATGFGGYSAPTIPAVGACKSVSVNAAKKVVAAFPGRIREIGCKRDCSCPGSSDHCCGLATDFMCSDGGGSATLSGKEIAEWCMKNRNALNLKYVIWGQKIWTTSVDKTEKKWENWRTMEKRDGLTQNHWDHVHVSYNG
ncbi:hypothetical protein NXS19_007579 [Fusarium pseudograminearum]|uniref:ARB-07466-like C-terminal domain-containing protein n=1 Tax=Fusarium pseudograminearum (strain CS3096) TaxID=1028729 RepID=K3VYR0_FUSPC|nr:hypothetical protein FPSE_08749 [Fusarium pseudograminearum CS3096]EKJ71085.1 hypothetical protein FPSE_08749 [Fusarium pseudograminearum CS3096]KAF0639355.1 hypothetical protein FPSE5266_08749 [Fusarium pseudograminearum]UZP39763.1 hypothetical protein NXS19_007579 [Fusarium pseudograminearum]